MYWFASSQLIVSLLACERIPLILITILIKVSWKKQIHCSATPAVACRKQHICQLSFKDFHAPFGGTQAPWSRFVKLGELMPWQEVVDTYASQFNQRVRAPMPKCSSSLDLLGTRARLPLIHQWWFTSESDSQTIVLGRLMQNLHPGAGLCKHPGKLTDKRENCN